jgi:hypothetical protein
MALSTGSGKLNLALKELRLHWDEVRTVWNDPVSQAFEENHYTPLEMQIIATLRELDRLALAIDQAKRDCG